MKIKCLKENLLKAMTLVQNVINNKSALPILSNVLLETMKDKIKVTATDLDIGMLTEVEAEIEREGSITIPAKRFFDIVREIPDGAIEVDVRKNNQVVIENKPCFFKIMGLPKDEFPTPPVILKSERLLMAQTTLKQMLKLTSFAMSHNETRYILNGMLFKIENGFLELAATDGRRLAVVKKTIDIPKGLIKEVVIPIKTINELNRILGDDGEIEILLGVNQVSFYFGNVKIISRVIEGEFPKYAQVIPEEAGEKIKINRNRFIEAIKRINLLTSQDSPSIKLDLFKNKIVVSKNAPELGQGEDVVDLAGEYRGKEFSIGFNPNYLTEVLKNIDDEDIYFELTSSEKPAAIRLGQEYVYVVLPMQTT